VSDLAIRLTIDTFYTQDANGTVCNCVTAELAAEAAAEIEQLTLKCKGSLANNLCPDHRDKQAGKPCLACEIELLTAELNGILDASRAIMAEPCDAGEVHCTCVPLLRMEIERLRSLIIAAHTRTHGEGFNPTAEEAIEDLESFLDERKFVANMHMAEINRLRNLLERVPHEKAFGGVGDCYPNCLRCEIDRVLKGDA